MQPGNWDFSQELFIRLGLALLAGVVLGLNRWLHHKSAGIRTHSLVSLGAALAMLAISTLSGGDAQAASRVMQGLLTGMGFLGAGVIIQINHTQRVRGLTTAANLWACALLGASFGAGLHALGLTALFAVMLVLLLGGSIEHWTGNALGIKRSAELPDDESDRPEAD
ncbi:MgtC/SapB family protein [Uliginosibacterium sp. H3]|uniref:Protein MgtC n=1 Tax=Uliginosibacterium silvisoli TaxID=3114758 RepID=A0ABU6JYE0_9RHOO|nr:MgtC/SapB family protein [Uliginosibacterium sp. H3]